VKIRVDEPTDLLPRAASQVSRREVNLVILEGPGAGRRIPVQGERLVIGKAPDSDLCLPDSAVSRNHCELVRLHEGYVIRDLGSTNGTHVDGIRVREAFLRPGARLQVGNAVILFQPVYQADAIVPSAADAFGDLVGKSLATRQVFAILERVAPTDATVLLTGETGTGKGAAAKALHEASPRRGAPFVVVDCGSVSPSLIQGELFGAEKGAYTGADRARAGAFEEADGGTLFLDEIDELPLDLQPKLLRVLEEREVRRLGSTKARKLDLRVVAATKVDLAHLITEGRFREDLYFRLSVVRVELPPLRDRTEDLPLLAARFLGSDAPWESFSEALREQLLSHPWPGNVRELRNVLDRLRYLGMDGDTGLALEPSGVAEGADEGEDEVLPPVDFNQPFKDAKESLVDAFEREYLVRLLERSGGRIAAAAREARLNRQYFYDLLRKHDLYDKGR
jgi:DNA-binding NtrC family response regulator